MKRGIDEKNMGPMFPRLHVNDTEKGGPRAPPRNKMALYEQLSIPSVSQRLTGNPNSSANYTPPPLSSSQGGMNERGSFFPLQQAPSMHAVDKTNNRYSDLNNQLLQQHQKKNQENEDFRVPIFNQQSGINHDGNGYHQIKDNSAFSGRLTNVRKFSEINNSQEFVKAASNQSSRQSTKVHSKETNASNNSMRLQSNGNSRDHVVDSQKVSSVKGNSVSNENIRTVGYGNSLLPVIGVQQVIRSPNDPINGDDVSETSMVDSISGADISPDDVVGIIGQKQFWKARRAIVNQQRVFAVQLFELHRLIKVQRLIAGLPQVMIDEDAFIGKPAKVTPIKKIPVDYVLKSSTNIPKIKDYSEKPKNDTKEFSAENAVEKASVQNSNQSTISGYPFPPFDPRMGPWSMTHPTHQTGHQWLIPVMSPSEGLIYKPYPGPPMGNNNFMNHGGPPPGHPHYQWPTGPHPMIPPSSHGYFPPYGMPPIHQSTSEETNHPCNMQYQTSSNTPTMVKSSAAHNSNVQVSEATSPINTTPNRDPLPLFPTCPVVGGEEPSRVIRVVPRNARSASESVARIFKFIQDERKQQDSN